jgi:hypothetical protein
MTGYPRVDENDDDLKESCICFFWLVQDYPFKYAITIWKAQCLTMYLSYDKKRHNR